MAPVALHIQKAAPTLTLQVRWKVRLLDAYNIIHIDGFNNVENAKDYMQI